MSLTLVEAAKVSGNQREAKVMNWLATESFVLDRLPFDTITGNAYQYETVSTISGAEFRAVNSAYTESTGTFGTATEGLVILGGDADVDRYLQLTRSNLNDQLAIQSRLKAIAIQGKFADTFVNGDTAVDANSFNGLAKRIGVATSAQHINTAGLNGAAINTDSASRQTFFDLLNDLIAAVPSCDVLYTNAAILSKIRSAMRRETMYTNTVDGFGRTVDTYNGITVVDIGNKADGTPIIPQTETRGTSAISGSVYAVNFSLALGNQGVIGLTNGGVQVMPLGQLETKPVFRVRIEWFCGLGSFGTKASARLSGVLAT